MFNLSLVMILAVFICWQNLHFHKVLRSNEVVDLQYRFSEGSQKVIFFLVGGIIFLFENF